MDEAHHLKLRCILYLSNTPIREKSVVRIKSQFYRLICFVGTSISQNENPRMVSVARQLTFVAILHTDLSASTQ